MKFSVTFARQRRRRQLRSCRSCRALDGWSRPDRCLSSSRSARGNRRRVARGNPRAAEVAVEELLCHLGAARQSLRELRRTLAVIAHRRCGPGIPASGTRHARAGRRDRAIRIATAISSNVAPISSFHWLYLHGAKAYLAAKAKSGSKCAQRLVFREPVSTPSQNRYKTACANYSMKSPDNLRSIREEAVRRATRAPQRKRFYASAGVGRSGRRFCRHARRQADPHAVRSPGRCAERARSRKRSRPNGMRKARPSIP